MNNFVFGYIFYKWEFKILVCLLKYVITKSSTKSKPFDQFFAAETLRICIITWWDVQNFALFVFELQGRQLRRGLNNTNIRETPIILWYRFDTLDPAS